MSALDVINSIISIHALRMESDGRCHRQAGKRQLISIHALRMESDMTKERTIARILEFLSTLSAWRATRSCWTPADCSEHFYPRSPHGERRGEDPAEDDATEISIHALRMESDRPCHHRPRQASEDFYPRSPHGERQRKTRREIIVPIFLSTLSAWRATP